MPQKSMIYSPKSEQISLYFVTSNKPSSKKLTAAGRQHLLYARFVSLDSSKIQNGWIIKIPFEKKCNFITGSQHVQ
jgi:hypothetical protein